MYIIINLHFIKPQIRLQTITILCFENSECGVLLRIQTLEAALRDCRKELTEEKAKMGELKEHFKYNLRLIGDRDAELQRYDTLFSGKVIPKLSNVLYDLVKLPCYCLKGKLCTKFYHLIFWYDQKIELFEDFL